MKCSDTAAVRFASSFVRGTSGSATECASTLSARALTSMARSARRQQPGRSTLNIVTALKWYMSILSWPYTRLQRPQQRETPPGWDAHYVASKLAATEQSAPTVEGDPVWR